MSSIRGWLEPWALKESSQKADSGVFGRAEVCQEHWLTNKVQPALCPIVPSACACGGAAGNELHCLSCPINMPLPK